jgi:hypothetical protein
MTRVYAPNGVELASSVRQAAMRLKCSREVIYKASVETDDGRILTRWPKPNGKRGPDKQPRKQRPRWEPTL